MAMPRQQYRFRGRDVHAFTAAERARWASGHWNHSWHGGRFGWGWDVDGIWYLYTEPIYPYPDAASDTAYDDAGQSDQSSDGVAPVSDGPMGQPPPLSWYYCDASKSYYPYVSSCPGGWRAVPATPSQ